MGDETQKQMLLDIASFETRLGLTPNFTTRLIEEDDWSFIVKLSALFEAACGSALIVKIGQPLISIPLGQIEHANQRYGKITLLLNLGVIEKHQSDFLTKLAALRNRLVHQISEVEFSLKIFFIENVDAKDYIRSFIYKPNTAEGSFAVEKEKKLLLSSPKVYIWGYAMEIFACLHLVYSIEELEDKKRELEAGQNALDKILKALYSKLEVKGLLGEQTTK